MAARRGKIPYGVSVLLLLVSVAIVASLAANAYYIYSYKQPQTAVVTLPTIAGNISNSTELSLDGFTKIDRNDINVSEFTDYDKLILAKGCTGLIGQIDPVQGASIQDALDNAPLGARPNTHDLIKDIFNVTGIKVLMVKVVDLKGSSYVGKLVIQQGSMIASLVSRPSDGVAIALRTGAPVYINTTLFNEKGQNVCNGTVA